MPNCLLCPRKCNIDRTRKPGFCGCTDTLRVARAAPHYWEEPCISGANGSGAVFFSGCNLGCVFCQNKPLSRDHAGIDIDIDRLSEIFIELQDKGVHNINLVTPTPWSDKIKTALDAAWQKGLWIPVVYNCGGYESAEIIASLSGYVSVYLPDFKYMDKELGQRFSLAPDYPETAKRALYEMVSQRGGAKFDENGIMTRGVIVRHLVLPGHTNDSMKVLDYLHTEYGSDIYISIMNQYTPSPDMTGELASPLSEKEYCEVLAYADEIGIKNGFIQEGETAKESFIPIWNYEGVIKPI